MMQDAMPAATLWCWRCQHVTDPVRPWPHWAKVRFAYFAGLALALCGGPVILADGFVMIPTLMLYMSAIGPINRLARQRPECNRCSAML
ncbi:MAG: hypothetical protein ACHQ53_02140 [Polyangiales bacterium]